MAIAHDAAPASERRRWDWLADNPIVRGFGRVPLPLGAKLIAAFTAGLPLSRKLVELHGAKLWVESQVSRGSAFRFTLPASQETAA